MKRLSALLAEDTVTRASQNLTAEHPVHVILRSTPRMAKDGALPSIPGPASACGLYRCTTDERREISPHDHQHHEITLVLGGEATHCTPHYEARLRRGDVVVAAPGQVHGFKQIDGLYRLTCVYLSDCLVHHAEELCSEPGALLPFLPRRTRPGETDQWMTHHHLSEEEFGSCLQEMRAMMREERSEAPSLTYLEFSLGKLIILIGRSLAETEEVRGASPRREMLVALQCIERAASSCQSFDRDALARECGLSTSHFTRLFREMTGISPRAYFQQRRIQHACWLLAHTEHPITDIASSLGFADAPHFVRTFHKLCGWAPGAYRAQFSQMDEA